MNPYKHQFKDGEKRERTSRPEGVTIIGITAILTAAINLSGGLFLILYQNESILQDRFVLPGFLDTETSTVIISTAGIIMIVLGLILPLISFGLLRGRNWAWNGSVGLLVLGGILFVVMSFSNGQVDNNNDRWIVPAIITGAATYYLYRPHVRKYFGKENNNMTRPSSYHRS